MEGSPSHKIKEDKTRRVLKKNKGGDYFLSKNSFKSDDK